MDRPDWNFECGSYNSDLTSKSVRTCEDAAENLRVQSLKMQARFFRQITSSNNRILIKSQLTVFLPILAQSISNMLNYDLQLFIDRKQFCPETNFFSEFLKHF